MTPQGSYDFTSLSWRMSSSVFAQHDAPPTSHGSDRQRTMCCDADTPRWIWRSSNRWTSVGVEHVLPLDLESSSAADMDRKAGPP